MSMELFQNPIAVIAIIVLFVLYVVEFVLRMSRRTRFSMEFVTMIYNTVLIVALFLLKIPVEELILVLMLSAIISILVGKMKGREE